MQRQTILAAIALNIPNAIQQQQGNGVPVTQTVIEVITDAEGKQVGYPGQLQRPMIPADITDDVLATMNALVAYLGLQVTRAATAASAEA